MDRRSHEFGYRYVAGSVTSSKLHNVSFIFLDNLFAYVKYSNSFSNILFSWRNNELSKYTFLKLIRYVPLICSQTSFTTFLEKETAPQSKITSKSSGHTLNFHRFHPNPFSDFGFDLAFSGGKCNIQNSICRIENIDWKV